MPFAVAGFFVPDLMLRSEVKRRREAIFLDLPEIESQDKKVEALWQSAPSTEPESSAMRSTSMTR